MRTLLLLTACSVALLLYQTHRDLRRESPREEEPSLPAASAAPPAPREYAAPVPAGDSPGAAHLPDPTRGDALPYEPLGAMERSLLRESHEEWRAPPGELLDRELPPDESRAVAIAFLRGALREGAERRLGGSSRSDDPPPLRAHLTPVGSVLVGDPRWRGDRLDGTTLDGREIRIPASAIRSLETLGEAEAVALRRAAFDEEVAALSQGGADELTEALERILRSGDLPLAEARFGEWLAAGGPAALLASDSDPERRARLETVVARLAESHPVAPGTPAAARDGRRDPAALAAFLDAPVSLRDLTPEERAARALECGLWSDWLAAEGDRTSIPAAERSKLEQRLRLLRYDLLKGSGF